MSEERYNLTLNSKNRLAPWRSSKIIPLRHVIHEVKNNTGHPVYALSLAPDGQSLYNASNYGSNTSFKSFLVEWDLIKGCRRRDLGKYYSDVLCVSPDGRYIYRNADKWIYQIDLASGSEVRVFEGHTEKVMTLALSLDGRTLFSGSHDTSVIQWDTMQGSKIRTFQHGTWHSLSEKPEVRSIAVSVDGSRIFCGTAQGQIFQWNLENGQNENIFTGHDGMVFSLQLLPDGRFLYSGSNDKTIVQWDLEHRSMVRRFTGHAKVREVCISPDGRYLYSAADGGIIKWDTANGNSLTTLTGHNETIWGLVLSPDGRRLYSGSFDNTIKAWDTDSGDLLLTIYQLDHGFFFTTPPDETSPGGYFWTDREDLIDVIKADQKNCDNHRILSPEDDEARLYFLAHNRQDIVMARLNNPVYRRLINEVKGVCHQARLENRKKEEQLFLGINADNR